MAKSKFKRLMSLAMVSIIGLSSFANYTPTALAAVGDKANFYMVDYPRAGDSNAGGDWGHRNLTFMNGSSSYAANKTGLKALGSYSGNIVYCIEPGVGLDQGDTMTEKDENYFNNLSGNSSMSGDDIRLFIGRILNYGYKGRLSTKWKSQNESDANNIAHAYATQILIWETIVGERDVTFGHVTVPSGYNSVFQVVSPTHPLRNKITEYYNSMVANIQSHTTVPSFCTRTNSKANVEELEWDGSKYTTSLTDSKGVLNNYDFSASIEDVTFAINGNELIISMTEAPIKEFSITATKKNAKRRGIVVWSDGNLNGGIQDVVSYAQEVNDPVMGFVKAKVSYGSCAIVKTSEDGIVNGIQFTIEGEGVKKTVTTSNGGKLQIDNLYPGTYTVTEESLNKYEPQNSQKVTVLAGQTAEVEFNNKLKRGTLKVIKSSEDYFIEGIEFKLSGTSLSGEEVSQTVVTDTNGVATFENVLISGDTPYVIEEVDTAIRYVVPENQTASIKWNEVVTRDFTNILKKFSVTVTKIDSEKELPQGDATLEGAVYGIYKDDTLVDQYTTDMKGQFTTKEYVCDSDWTIREISPSEGYLLDETVHKIGAEPEKFTVERNPISSEVTEKVIKGNIGIIKHTDNGDTQIETPEEGATFEVYLKSAGSYENANADEKDVITCDENGYGETKDLSYGVYTVHQTSGWEGREYIDDFDVFISENSQTYRYIINNAMFESYLEIVKADKETGKTIPYEGAGFEIYDPNGNKISMTFMYPTPTTIDTFYTNKDGKLVTPETLEYGIGYSLVEVQAPYGYVLDKTPVYFDVVQEDSLEEGGVTLIKVKKANMAQKGRITIEKTGEVYFGVSSSGDEKSEVIYQPVYNVEGLGDAIYEIKAREDIITPDGMLRYKNGEVVDTITTTKEGVVTSKELYLGKYSVTEIKAPDGMVVNSEVYNIELTYADQEVAITETSTSFYNERQKIEVSLEKFLEKNDDYGIGNNTEIPNISFGLYANEDIISTSGTIIPKDGLLEIITISIDGKATINTDLPFGSYYIREIATDEHYLLSDIKFEFTFAYTGQDVEVVQLDVNDGKPIENKLIYGEVEGKKVDEAGAALERAVIGIFKAEETEFTKETAIKTTTSKEDGSFGFKKVPYGTWIVREIEQPKGFVLDETSYEVNISENKEVIEIEIINEYVFGDIKLTKVDTDYPDSKLSGATFELYKDINENGEIEKEDELLGILDETSTGIYEAHNLPYGHYLVKEVKAPEGFVLDDKEYSIFIEQDETVYEVENKVGIGFVNNAMEGTLKITKTSSDGKVEGFTFKVTGPNNYDRTFTTDKNGVIMIDKLRIGEYKISEVRDDVSAGYILAKDQSITIEHEKTEEVKMHNTLRETPKTGDNRNTSLWFMLAGISVLGIGATVFLSKKRNRN